MSHMIICINHRQYRGESAPILSCKACCGIFIAKLKENQQKTRGLQPLSPENIPNELAPAGNGSVHSGSAQSNVKADRSFRPIKFDPGLI